MNTIPEPDHSWWNPKLHVEHPMGLFLAQPVGNTSYGTGLHVRVRLTGEDEDARGLFSFGAQLGTDGTVTWMRQQRSYVIKHDRADEIFEVAFELARTWFERDPSHCASYYHGLAEKGWRELNRLLKGEAHIRDHLGKLLDDEEAPRTRNQKNEDGEWEIIPLTEEERATMRALWERNRRRAIDKLAKLHAEHDARILQLRGIQKQCLDFLNARDYTVPLLPFEAVAPSEDKDPTP